MNSGGQTRLPRLVVLGAVAVAVLALVVHNQLVPFDVKFFGLLENDFDLSTYRSAYFHYKVILGHTLVGLFCAAFLRHRARD